MPGRGHLHAALNAAHPGGHKHEDEHHSVLETNHGVAKGLLMPGFGGFLLCILVGAGFAQWRPVAAIPMSAWTILVSCIGGLMLRNMFSDGVITVDWYMRAASLFLNLGLLPVIIFSSGWTLNHMNFVSQLEHIAIFAVLGTLIATLFVGLSLSTLGIYEFHIVNDVRSNFAFAALISAVDPVATLSTLAKLGLDRSQPLLHTMIFGESVVNDAVAIVLFKALNDGKELTPYSIAFQVSKLLFGSWILGHVVSCVLIFFLRCARLPGNTVPETLYIVCSAWFIFALAEGMGLSGIIANLWAGMMFRMYGSQLLVDAGVEMTSHFLEVAAEMSDTMVFMVCGVSSALVSSLTAVWFALFAVFLCLVARGLSTSTCTAISNGVKRMIGAPEGQELTFAHQVMMWHAGLRGGIALVLALEIDSEWCDYKAAIINTTFLIVCVYLVVFGSTTEIMLKRFGFSGSSAEHDEEELPAEGEEAHGEERRRSVGTTGPERTSVLWQEMKDATSGDVGRKIRTIEALHGFQERLLVGDRGKLENRRKVAQDHWKTLQSFGAKRPTQAP
jgi:NhaP-type Na+/H+ or K+/H+ antiporter